MKKKLFVVLVISAGLVYFTSCKKDKEESGFVDVPFSTNQNVEQEKAKLEDNAQLAVAELNSFADEKGIEAVNSLADFMSDADPMASSSVKSAKSNLVFSTVNKLKAASVKNNPREIFGSINTILIEDPQSIKEVWDSIKGIYTWNFANHDWDYAASTTVAEFHFPSKKTGTTNNAVFTISSYKGVVVSSPLPDYTGDLPTEIKANLKVDGTEYFAYSFAASYTNQGIPSSVVTSVAFRSFVFTFEFSNSTSNISINYKFTNGTKTIFDIGGAVNGNFTQTAMENSDGPEDVFYNGNAHFQLFNVKIAGMVDVVKISEAEKKIYANEYNSNFDYIKADSLMAIEINKNAKLIAFFVDTQQKIANIEAYRVVEEHNYYYGSYTDSYIDFRLVFADGSPSNADNYFGEGFSGLVTDINALLAELNDKFGADFEPITY
jgi:hypothetical protein